MAISVVSRSHYAGKHNLCLMLLHVLDLFLISRHYLCVYIILLCNNSNLTDSGQQHSNWWWRHDTGSPRLAAEHLLCTVPWSGTPCPTTSTHSRTMSLLNRAWKLGCSLGTSMHSTLETFVTMRYINLHLPLLLPFQLMPSSHVHKYAKSVVIDSLYLTDIQTISIYKWRQVHVVINRDVNIEFFQNTNARIQSKSRYWVHLSCTTSGSAVGV